MEEGEVFPAEGAEAEGAEEDKSFNERGENFW